jgi:hypothetical protein
MGLSQYGFALFIARQKMGSGLGRVLTLGRQRAAMGYGNAERLVREAGLVWNADKLEPTSPWGDSTLLAAGAQTVNSMDYSTHESCSIVHDLNHPVKGDLVGAFDTVFDGGTLEHVCDFPTAMRNCITMLADGGVFMAETPSNNWMGHGFYQFSPELLYRVFCEANGCRLLSLALFREGLVDQIFAVDDPANVGSRVRFNVTGRTSLLVMAQKLRTTEDERGTMQQSDYQTLWRQASNDVQAQARRGTLSFLPHAWLRGLDNLRTDWERWRNRHRGLRRLRDIPSIIQHCTASYDRP